MSIGNQQAPEVDEDRWNAWLRNGKDAERRTANRMKIAAGVLLSLAAICSGVYLLTR